LPFASRKNGYNRSIPRRFARIILRTIPIENPAYNKGVMPMQVEAVYENGVLRPLEPLELAEHQHVTVTVTESANRAQLELAFIENPRKELQTAPPAPGLEEVRRRLAKIPGSMTDDFIAEREDR
jgi:predicted DNA-binding antitoxin AbrB/MazE fold protein